LFGIQDHFYAFSDCPEVIHEMNNDLVEFCLFMTRELCSVLQPDFMTFAEDMSYNHGPMLSHDLYTEFMLPYYKRIVPELKKNNVKVFIDTDGFLEPMIPWFLEAGIEGVLPLEKQAGVDINNIRRNYPEFLMIGAFDKTCMNLGEGAMRAEFERILPVMRSGGYIPGCDHQTPPLVSIDDYKIYVRLLNEYARKAVE
jgi:uroporphyrinogen-III decarboxylase